MHSWAYGSPDRDQPPAPPASQDAVMVPLSTQEQYLIRSSSSSIPSAAAAASAAAAVSDQGVGRMEHLEQDVSSSWVDMSAANWNSQIAGVPAPTCWDFGTNPNPTGGPIVPARLPVMQPQTPQDICLNQFREVSVKCGFPRSACDIVWPKNGRLTHPRDITRIMERNSAHIDHEFIDSHNIQDN